MFRCGALWRRFRRRPQDPAYADTAVIPILQPGPLDRPARLLHPRQARRATTRSHRSAVWARRAARLGLLGLAVAVGGAAWWALDPARSDAVLTAPRPSPPGAATTRAAALPTPAVAAVPASVPAVDAASGGASWAAAASAAGAAFPAASAAVPDAAGGWASVPLSAASRPARGARPAPAQRRLAALQHEWQVAEAMRLRYRALHAQGLVDWEAWQARENEALRLRLQLQALGHPPPAASAR